MREARQMSNASLGRCAMQGKADVRGKALWMGEASPGSCAKQGKSGRMCETRQDGCERQGRADARGKA
jgi:hypothetical protein